MNINKEILRLAGPNILSNISIPLLSTVDTALMGHLSIAHLGAVGIGSMIFNFVYWNFGFLRMGTTGISAQNYGQEDDIGISVTLFRSLYIALIISAILLLLSGPLMTMSKYLLNIIPNQQGLVSEYFNIRIWAAPATLGLYVLMGWFFGMQNSIYPLIITIFVNVINLILSYFLVAYLGWEIRGVAYGTLIAQYLGFFLACTFLMLKYKRYLGIGTKKVLGRLEDWATFFNVNVNLFIRTVCLTLAFAFFYSNSSASGELVLASNVIMLQLLNWLSYGIDGFAFASESLVGKYYGARNKEMLGKVIKYTFIWGGGLAMIYGLIYGLFGGFIIDLYSDDTNVKAFTNARILSMAFLPIFAFSCYMWDGIYIGLTAVKEMRNTMLLSFVIYLSFFYAFRDILPDAAWWSLVLFLTFRGLLQTIYWFYNKNLISIKSIY